MIATVVLGYAEVGIERRREEGLLRYLDRAVHVTVAKITITQKLDDAFKIRSTKSAGELRRHACDLLELRVGERDHRHLFESSRLEKWGSRPVLEGEEVDQTRQALLEIYCAVVLATPYNDFATH